MRLEEIDPNFKIEEQKNDPEIEWHHPREYPFALYGVNYDENLGQYVRMPLAIAEQVSDGVAYLCKDTAGGRIRFCTDSPKFSLFVKSSGHVAHPHMPKSGGSGFDLYRKLPGQERELYFGSFIPPNNEEKEYVLSFNSRRKGQMAEYTVNMPLYDRVYEVYVGLKKGSKIEPASPYRFEKPVVCYGSSITQGGCASRPGNAYQGFISRDYNIDYINLGFSGSGKGEPEMAEYIASLSMQAFVCDYDHNAPDLAHLQATLEPFYRIIRKAHPELPIIFISKPDILLKPELDYGSDVGTCVQRRDFIRSLYEKAKAAGENVYFVDGAELFAGDHWDACTVDGTHPNDLGFYRMAKRIGEELKKALNL